MYGIVCTCTCTCYLTHGTVARVTLRNSTDSADAPKKLWNKEFSAYFALTGFSAAGTTFTVVATSYLIMEYTQSASSVAINLAVSGVAALLSPFAGTLVDRYKLKPILVGADVARGIVLFLLVLLASLNELSAIHIYAVSFINALLGTVYRPAIGKLMPRIVPEDLLMTANGLLGSLYNTINIAGYFLGGLFVAFLGSVNALIFDAITFVVMGIGFLFINTKDENTESKTDGEVTHEESSDDHQEGHQANLGMIDVFKIMVSSGIIICPVIIFLTYLHLVPFRVFIPKNYDSEVFGAFFALYFFGSLLADLLISKLGKKMANTSYLVASLLICCIFILVPIISKSETAYYITAFLLAFAGTIAGTISFFGIQTLIKDEIRGRVFGIMGMLELGLIPLAYIFISQNIDKENITYAIIAIIGVVIAAYSFGVAKSKNMFPSS